MSDEDHALDEFRQQLKQAMELVYEVMGDPKLAQSIARMYRQLYHSLKEEGFTDEQALTIVQAFKPSTTKGVA